MALTTAEKQFFQKMASDGVSKEDAIGRFKAAKTEVLETASPTVSNLLGLKGEAAKTETQKGQIAGIEQKRQDLGEFGELASPTVAGVLDVAQTTLEKDVAGTPIETLRPGEAIEQKIDETIGKVPLLGRGLSSLAKDAISPVTTGIDVASRTVEGVKGGAEKLAKSGEQVGEAFSGIDVETGKELTAGERVIKAGGGLFGGARGTVQTIFAPLGAAIAETSGVGAAAGEKIGAAVEVTGRNFAENIGIDPDSEQGQAIVDGIGVLSDLLFAKGATKVPAAIEAVAPTVQKVAKKVTQKVQPAVGKTVEAGKAVVQNVKDIASLKAVKKAKKTALKETEALTEIAKPKATAKEIKIALEEGRVQIPGRTFFKGKAPDTILPSKGVKSAVDVVRQKIPNAAKLDKPQMVNALNNEITSSAQSLKPQMKQVKVTEGAISKVNNEWAKAKKAQQANPEFDAFGGSKKAQSNFENILKEAEKAKNLDALWEARIKYDNLVSDSIKNATDASAPSSLFQKQIWLENRSILKNVMESESLGLGGTAKKAFNEMSSMFEMKNNIKGNFKVDVKGEAGFVKRGLKKAAISTAGVVGGWELIKKLF